MQSIIHRHQILPQFQLLKKLKKILGPEQKKVRRNPPLDEISSTIHSSKEIFWAQSVLDFVESIIDTLRINFWAKTFVFTKPTFRFFIQRVRKIYNFRL
jgi:hypothetical protein